MDKRVVIGVVVVFLVAASGGALVMDWSGDGLSAGEDLYHGTDPLSADTSGNGLTDYEEIHEYKTNPLVVDTTGDGLTDYEEVREHGTDPTVVDTTGDGLTDYEEINQYGTDPTTIDTTGDGLTDYDEIHVYGTDPTTVDTTDDGLRDYDEINQYGTDPTVRDTTGDGIGDAVALYGDEIEPILFEDVDPLQHNIIIEIDVMEDQFVNPDEIQRVQDAFNDAPVKNEDGTTGINLHIVYGTDRPAYQQTTSFSEYRTNHQNEYYSSQGLGTRHVMVVNDARANGDDVLGVTTVNGDGMLVEASESGDVTGPTLMHELGHTLGIGSQDHVGVDSTVYESHEYPSIMNYNHQRACQDTFWFGEQCTGVSQDEAYHFSDGTNGPNDFDDWGHIEDNMNGGVDDSDMADRVKEYLEITR